MKKYKNLSHKSGVKQYKESPDELTIRFKDGSVYTYDEDEIGKRKFARMEQLAEKGRGLATLIARDPVVRSGYSKRVRGAK